MDGAARKHPITVNSSKNLSYHEYFAHRYFLTICLVHSCYVKVRTGLLKVNNPQQYVQYITNSTGIKGQITDLHNNDAKTLTLQNVTLPQELTY